MTDELKPCPFCGEDAAFSCDHIETVNGHSAKFWDVSCDRCGAQTDYYSEEQGGEVAAIAAWNTRYERTCTMTLKHFSGWHCSACGELATLTGTDETFRNLNYCPSCGAKVVRS